MDTFAGALLTAFWFGLLTAVSPCPFATNITAVSFIAKQVGSAGTVLKQGIVYTLGRLCAYVLLGSVLTTGLLSVPVLSNALQKYGHLFIGPMLIVVGMMLLELIGFVRSGAVANSFAQKFAQRGDTIGAGVLGFVFALAFCPISAALFFGALLPLATNYQSGIAIPVMYGLGTSLPVLAVALIISQGARMIGAYYTRMTQFEYWARRITGVVFILAGLYLSVVHVLISS